MCVHVSKTYSFLLYCCICLSLTPYLLRRPDSVQRHGDGDQVVTIAAALQSQVLFDWEGGRKEGREAGG